MSLRYDGSMWSGLLDAVLGSQIETAIPRLQATRRSLTPAPTRNSVRKGPEIRPELGGESGGRVRQA